MARNSTGKWVQRAGATGGGRTYRGQTPFNWYATLVIIVVLGFASIVWARYQYRHPAAKPSAQQPAVGVTWYSGFVFDICGVLQPSPAANNSKASTLGMYTTGSGVITIAPKTSAQAGANAVLGQFIDSYPDMELSQTKIQSPGMAAMVNGDKCPAGTPDAGKAGMVTVGYWEGFSTKHPTIVSGNPAQLRLGNDSRISMAFLPAGVQPQQPPGTVVEALLNAATAAESSTTLPAAATTVPATTPTTAAPAATTTAPPTTTTAPPTTTTTHHSSSKK